MLLSGDVLQPTAATTTVTCRDGGLRVQDGPFAETKEALAGVFLLDVPDLDAAIGWAEKCPGAALAAVTAEVDGPGPPGPTCSPGSAAARKRPRPTTARSR